MEQFGILENANNLNEFISDERKKLARDNLNIGSLGLQDSNDVVLFSDKITVSDLTLSPGANSSVEKFLISSNDAGTITFGDFSIASWTFKVPENIFLSGFSNDCIYVSVQNDLLEHSTLDSNWRQFMMNESLLHLKYRPSFQELANVYGLDDGFLEKSSNLDDLMSAESSRSNLGLTILSTYDSNDVVLTHELNINSNLKFDQESNVKGSFLFVDEFGNVTKYQSPLLPMLDFFSNDNRSTPSSQFLSNNYQKIKNRLDENAYSNKTFLIENEAEIKDLIHCNVLYAEDNFPGLSSTEQNLNILNNLHIGTAGLLNDTISVDKVTVNESLKFEPDILMTDLFYVDSEWMDKNKMVALHMAKKNDTNGFVDSRKCVTLSNAMYQSNVYASKCANTKQDVQLSIDDFEFNLLTKSNLVNSDSAEAIRHNLKLHDVAITGRLSDLSGRPFYLSELVNDVNYYERNKNLGDIHPLFRSIARSNIGIGSIATEDAENIGGTEGIPLGINNYKFHSRDCVINRVIVPTGKFNLKNRSQDEIDHDFLCVEKHNQDGDGFISFGALNTGLLQNFHYRYKPIQKNDENFFVTKHSSHPFEYLRVQINDTTEVDLLDTDLVTKIPEDTILADYFVPSCKFSYIRFMTLVENLLAKYEIPSKYYERLDQLTDYSYRENFMAWQSALDDGVSSYS